jgi:hypothetical protein
MFSRQHYRRIAENLADNREVHPRTIEIIIWSFKCDNSRFEAGRFVEYFRKEYFESHGFEYPHEVGTEASSRLWA